MTTATTEVIKFYVDVNEYAGEKHPHRCTGQRSICRLSSEQQR